MHIFIYIQKYFCLDKQYIWLQLILIQLSLLVGLNVFDGSSSILSSIPSSLSAR